MDAILDHQPATHPPVVVSSMTGAAIELAATAVTAQLPVGTDDNTTISNSSLGEPADVCNASCESHLDGTQSADVPWQASSNQIGVTPLQQRKWNKSKGDDTIELIQKMLKAQKESGRYLVELKERYLEY